MAAVTLQQHLGSTPCSSRSPLSSQLQPPRRCTHAVRLLGHQRSSWRRTLGPKRPRRAAVAAPATSATSAPPLLHEVDVCVVGAGIIGLCTALALLRAEPQLSVALLDRQVPCAGATGAGQGYVWVAHRSPGSAGWELAVRSKKLWETTLGVGPGTSSSRSSSQGALTPGAVEWQRTGSLLLATSAAEGASLRERQAALQAGGLAAHYLDAAAAVEQLEPALRAGAAPGGALLVESDAQINGRATAGALQRACEECGGGRFRVLFHEGVETLVAASSGRVEGVKTTSGRRVRAARGVVLCAGAWTGPLLAQQLGDPRWGAAFQPRRGHLLELAPPSGMPPVQRGLMEVGYTKHYASSSSSSSGSSSLGSSSGVEVPQPAAVDITFTATTSASGTLLVGSSREFSGWGAEPSPDIVDSILERAAFFLPALAGVRGGAASVRVGLRPFAAAGRPTVGPVPGAEGLFVAAGHEGSGLTLGPATAELLCSFILERPPLLGQEAVHALAAQL